MEGYMQLGECRLCTQEYGEGMEVYSQESVNCILKNMEKVWKGIGRRV